MESLGSAPLVPVYLNVYDLTTDLNAWTYWAGVGIFHSGVEVYGVEYAFGGHEYDAPGVFATNPREAPGAVTWRESVVVGETSLPAAAVQRLVYEMGQEYKGNRYHLLQANCNHFSSDLCRRLTGEPAPAWVNRLAHVAVNLHCLLPTGWVPPLQPPTALPGSEVMPGPEEQAALLHGGRGGRASSSSSSLRPPSGARPPE